MKPTDFFLPAIAIGVIILIVGAVIFWRLRKFVFKQPEDKDKELIRQTRQARAEFVQSRSVEKGIQDHRFFDRNSPANKNPNNEENEQFHGNNNMFYFNDDPLAAARGGSSPETALALIFAFCSPSGTSETQKEAARVRDAFTKHGYKTVLFSHGANSAPPSSRQIASTLKHLMFSKRVWQNVAVYVCGSGRTVQVPSVANLQLESEMGKRLAASEQIVPVMWELLADYEDRSRNSNWIDLTTLLYRIRSVVRTTQPVAVFLDISISPLSSPSTSSDESKKKEQLVRASANAAENSRDELISILPAHLLSQLEIVFCRRDSFNAEFSSSSNSSSSSSSISKFNQLFLRAFYNARLEAQLNSLQSGGNSLLASATASFRLDYAELGSSMSAYFCGELSPASVAAFIREHSSAAAAASSLVGEDDDDEASNNLTKHLHHISTLVNSVALAVSPVYGPRCGCRPDKILAGLELQNLLSRVDSLWNIIHKNVSSNETHRVGYSAPICVRGFGTSTALRALTWRESCLRYFPDSVIYVDVAGYAPRRPPYRNFNAAFEQMWKSALQVVCNSFVSFNRTWDSVESCVECLKAAMLATDFSANSQHEPTNDAILLIFDNIPFSSDIPMIHPAVLEMVKTLGERDDGFTVQVVVGVSETSPVPCASSSSSEMTGFVNWMSNTAPLTKKDIETINKKNTTIVPPKSVILTESEASTELTAFSPPSSSLETTSAWNKLLVSSSSLESLEVSHKHLLLLIHWLQRDNQNCPVPLESVAHYAKLHCSRAITEVVRACGVSLLAQQGFISRTVLMQPRGCETDCVFVNPAVRSQLDKILETEKIYNPFTTSNSNNQNDGDDKETATEDEGTTSSVPLEIPNRYNKDQPVNLLRLANPKNTLEPHIWRVHVCFTVIPELRDPRLMSLASGMTLFNEVIRPYFPRFLISLAHYASATSDAIRQCVPSHFRQDFESLTLAPKHCYILLREFLTAPLVVGDMISTMGTVATADVLEACSAITAGKVSMSAPLFGLPSDVAHSAEKKLITALRSIPHLLDNQPYEWTFQFCHRDIRGYYNSLVDKRLFDRVFLPRYTEGMTDDEKFDAKTLSGSVVPCLTRATFVKRSQASKKIKTKSDDDKWKNIGDSSDDENEKKKKTKIDVSDDSSDDDEDENKVTYSDVLDFSHLIQDAEPTYVFPESKKYPTCIEYSPLSVSNTDPIRGNIVVGFSDGSVAVYKMFRDLEQSIATTNHVLPFDAEDPLFEVSAEEAHGSAPVTNILFDVERIEQVAGEAKIQKTRTKIITASRTTSKIFKWKHDLTEKEVLPRLIHGDSKITKCNTPLTPIIIRHSADPARLALDRIGIPSSEDSIEQNANALVGVRDHRKNTIATLESGGEVVLLTCGQEPDGERNGAMLALTEARQCVTSMTFDPRSYTKETMPKQGIITTASCGVDPFTRAIVVAVGDRSGRILQFELRVAHLEDAETILDKAEPARVAKRLKKQKEERKRMKEEEARSAAAKKLRDEERAKNQPEKIDHDDEEEEEGDEEEEEEENEEDSKLIAKDVEESKSQEEETKVEEKEEASSDKNEEAVQETAEEKKNK